MKKSVILILTLLCTGVAVAEFRTWTNADGKAAELKLLSVSDKDGEKVGEFKMRNGKKVELKASELSSQDAAALAEWKDAAAPVAAPASVFDGVLEGDLLRLKGKRLASCDDATKPLKYYAFYYTASWCPPCQAFTPSLVDWYKKNKNANVELVLISSDRSEDAMAGYAAAKKMPWPQLKIDKVPDFRGKFNHGVRGIPSLIVCDLDGKVLGNFRSNLPGLTDLVKD